MLISISTNTTTWFTHPAPLGLNTLRLTFPTGVTGTMKVVCSSDKSDSDKTGSVDVPGTPGTQISFASGGTYKSYYVDITGSKFIGIETTSISGGSVEAELLRSSK